MYQVSNSENDQQKIKAFTDLNGWKKAHQLAIAVYKVTDNFPTKEQFGLTSQIRRASVSVASNIAEGFSRSTKADKTHFYVMALGSLTEVQSQLLLSRDIGFLSSESCQKLFDVTVIVQKLLHGLRKSAMAGNGVQHE